MRAVAYDRMTRLAAVGMVLSGFASAVNFGDGEALGLVCLGLAVLTWQSTRRKR